MIKYYISVIIFIGDIELKIRHFIFFLTLLFVLLRVNDLYAAIYLTFGTGAGQFNPGTEVAGENYYKAGEQYTLVFRVTTTSLGSWTDVNNITLQFMNPAAQMIIVIDVTTLDISYPPSASSSQGGIISCSISGSYSDFIVTLVFEPNSSSISEIPVGSGSIYVSVGGASPQNNSFNHDYGITKDGLTGSVSLTLLSPSFTSLGSANYFIAGRTYRFEITGTANGHNWECLRNVTLTIPRPGGTSIVFSITPNGSSHNVSSSSITSESIAVSYDNIYTNWSGVNNPFRIYIDYTPSSNNPNINSVLSTTSPTITALVTSELFGDSDQGGLSANYGIVSQAITSISTNVTSGPTSIGSPTANYFLSGKTYKIEVTIGTIFHNWASCIASLQALTPTIPLTISLDIPGFSPGSGKLSIDNNTTGTFPPTGSVTYSCGGTVGVATSGTGNTFIVEFTYEPGWDHTFSTVVADGTNRSITPSASFGDGTIGTTTGITPASANYGVCLSAAVLLETTLTATLPSGIICANPWHDGFSITAHIVYNIANPVVANSLVDATAITASSLDILYSRNSGSYTSTSSDPKVHINATAPNQPIFSFDSEWFSDRGLVSGYADGIGAYLWRVDVGIGLLPAELYSPLSPPSPYIAQITCDKFIITNMKFSGGGGASPPDTPTDTYIRSINIAETKISVRAILQYSNTPQTTGSGTITLGYNYGSGLQTTPIPITFTLSSDGWSNEVEIINPAYGDVTPGTTRPISGNVYEITSILGSGGGVFGGVGQNLPGKIVQSATSAVTIYWENRDPPGQNAGGTFIGTSQFTDWISADPGSNSITLRWRPLDDYGPAITAKNLDFDTYRIYYKPTESTVWSFIDKYTSTTDTSILSLGNINGSIEASGTYTGVYTKIYRIDNLHSMYSYDYYLTALDKFGNETLLANRSFGLGDQKVPNPYGTVTTNPGKYVVKISDGITTYDDRRNEFEDVTPDNISGTSIGSLNPLSRPLRDSAIKVEVEIAGSGNKQPTQLNIILREFESAPFFPDVFYDLIGKNLRDDPTGVYEYDSAALCFRIPLSRVSPNRWQGFIPDGNRFIVNNGFCMFILETVIDGVPSYTDYDTTLDTSSQLNPNNYPWTFSIKVPPNIKPWPTMVLNNVITDKDPVAYPAYYLTDDAYVTITAYDIKGRVVAVLLDNAPRKKGINIKENGWRGTNRANRKLGVGLYYVRIKAVRQSDGKVLIDKYNKVVMAR